MPTLIPVDDPADPRLDPYLRVRERDLAGRDGFIAEGEVVLRVLARSARARAASVLLAEDRVAKLAPILEALPDATPVYVAAQAVMDAAVGFHIHRGILAHGLRPADLGAAALLAGLPARALVVALFGVANHDNMGGVFRNAAAFGADAVLLAADCCDPLYRKAIRVSVGATLTVPCARLAAGEDALALLANAGFVALALSPGGEAVLGDGPRPSRTALLLGAEGPGLPAEVLRRARTLRIPMAAGWDSLNLAAASAVALHELTRAG